MQMRLLFSIVWTTLAAWPTATNAQSDLQKNLKDTNVADHWIYDDIAAGFAEANETGKPLLVAFRCVP